MKKYGRGKNRDLHFLSMIGSGGNWEWRLNGFAYWNRLGRSVSRDPGRGFAREESIGPVLMHGMFLIDSGWEDERIRKQSAENSLDHLGPYGNRYGEKLGP